MSTDHLVTCGVCGAAGTGGAFCDSCGEPLPAAPRPDSGEPTPPLGQPAAGPGEPTLDEGPPIADQPKEPGNPASLSQRMRALILPVTDPSGNNWTSKALPVLPNVPEPARPVTHGPDRDELVSGPPCPWCGAPNPLDRHFCRRCAVLLASRPDAMRGPWWRRLLDRCRGWFQPSRREIPYAGQRPRLHLGPARLVRWTGLAAVVAAAVFAGETWGNAAVLDVRDHFAHPDQVFASTVTASRSDPAHPAAKLHDGFSNTFWGTGVTGDGAGTHIDAGFTQPVNLLDIVITPGAGAQPDAFNSQSAPQTVTVTLTRTDGTSTSSTITLADSPGAQTFGIRGDDVSRVRLTLGSAYKAQAPGAEVAIAEIEFFAAFGLR